jgi:hypothetical protein
MTVEDANSDIDTAQIDLTILFKGDFEPDGDVDLDDYAVFTDDWLYSVEAIGGPTPTSAWWKFDEESGSSAADSSVNNNTGTLYNMDDSDWIAGKFGNALEFDENDYVIVPAHSSMSFGTGSFSVAYWIKVPSDDSLGTSSHIVNGGDDRYEITRYGSTPVGQLHFIIDDDATGDKDIVTSGVTSFVTGDWVHAVCIRDAPNTDLYIYKDGVVVGSGYGHAKDIDSPDPMKIGDNGQPSISLDDIRLYDYVLSEDDIDDLYNSGPGVVDSPANLNGDEIVDFEDLAELTEDWLEVGY